jgi:hypothetical protein
MNQMARTKKFKIYKFNFAIFKDYNKKKKKKK